jgi:MtN3 and saliva related transmembrane protein
MDTFQELIGYCAAFCTTIAFLPQVIKVWRTRAVRDISMGMYVVLCAGLLLWTGYGWMLSSLPILVANGFTLVLAGIILFFKWRGE